MDTRALKVLGYLGTKALETLGTWALNVIVHLGTRALEGYLGTQTFYVAEALYLAESRRLELELDWKLERHNGGRTFVLLNKPIRGITEYYVI